MSDPFPLRELFSVGHSTHSIDHFLRLLRDWQIDVVADVRSFPQSRFAPQFNSEARKVSLRAAELKYVFLGSELGGRPRDSAMYDAEGHVLYWRVALSPLFLEGIERLKTGALRSRIAVLCTEENPKNCHRRLLVGKVLQEHGITLNHIRGDGTLQREEDLAGSARPDRVQVQNALFEQVDRDNSWKSIRSVLPSGRRRVSSEP